MDLQPQAPRSLRSLLCVLPAVTLTLETQAPDVRRSNTPIDIPAVTLALSPLAPAVTTSTDATEPGALNLLAEITADLDVFFPPDASGFARDFTGPDGVFRGTWQDEHYDGDRAGPYIVMREDALGTITYGSTITVSDSRFTTYTVEGVRYDGVGLVELLLEPA